jgi:hypothetical protein
MAEHVTMDTLRNYGVKVVDSIYSASVYSVVGYGALLVALAIIGMAVFLRVIDLPEFHPR